MPTALTLQQAIEATRPSIVQVEASDSSGKFTGTGFIADDTGLIVTAMHVVSPDQGAHLYPSIGVYILLNSKVVNSTQSAGNLVGVPARVVAVDVGNDIAVLLPSRNIFDDESFHLYVTGVSSPFGGPTPRKPVLFDLRQLHEGESIYTSGFPLGVSEITTTQGTVASADAELLRSDLPNVHARYTIDMRVNHGNSGGPAFTLQGGQVVGLVDAFIKAPVEGSRDNGYNSGLAIIVPSKYITSLVGKARRIVAQQEPASSK